MVKAQRPGRRHAATKGFRRGGDMHCPRARAELIFIVIFSNDPI